MSYRGTKAVAGALALLMCAGALLSIAPAAVAEPYELRFDLPPIGVAVSWSAVASVGENIYVIGGCQAYSVGLGSTFASVQIYNVNTGDVTYGATMPKGVGAAASGVGPDGKIYIAGGWNFTDGSYYQKVQVYDPVLDSWTTTAGDIPEPIGRSASAMAADGTLYVFGGGWVTNVTLMYNTQTDQWRYGADQPIYGYDAEAVAYDSTHVFVIGGIYGGVTSATSIYNPVADTWSDAASMPTAEAFGAAVLARNGYIYVFGGSSTGSTSDPAPMSSVMRYSVADDEWEYADVSLSSGRDHLSATVDVYGRAVALGGWNGAAAVNNVEAFVTSEISGEYQIQISSPQDGSIVSGVVEVQVDIVNSWGSGFVMIDLFVDGALLESRTWAVTAVFLWDTTGLVDGSAHTLMARGYNWDGSIVEASVSVTVSSMSLEERMAAVEQNIADIQAQLLDLQDQLMVQDANLTALSTQVAILQGQLTGLQAALVAMAAGSDAAMAELNATLTATLTALQAQLDDFQEQIDRIETKADSGGTLNMVTLVLVIVVIALLALMFMMARKKP